MPDILLHDPIYDFIVFQAILILVMLSNTRTLRLACQHPAPDRFSKVSVLVPARNEEANIERCIRSLLSQDYPDFEVLALDDESTDRTRAILDSLAGCDPRLRVLDGRPLEAGWSGKNWACAQLAARAAGALLFFTDADTFHRPGALRAMVTALEGERADLLSGFPRQEVLTWGEKLIVPFFSWVMYCFTPLGLGYRVKLPALSCAVGQMLLIRRTAYEETGGHGAVRSSIVEDLALARRFAALGYRWRMMRAAHLVSCRMYRGGREAFAGLSKNLFAAFGFRLVPFLFAWLWLLVLFVKPVADLGRYALGSPSDVPLAAVLACVVLALVLWLVSYRQLGLPLAPAALYPVTVLVMEVVAFRSLWLSLTGGL
ncbi:MAG TPA: glycosyltransferase, partial [Anaerolineae bacterium]|nr:glycosyltransferase [Anaerolineae bacterium]